MNICDLLANENINTSYVCVSCDASREYVLLSKQDYFSQKTWFGWNDRYKKLTLMELAREVHVCFQNQEFKLEDIASSSQTYKVENGAFEKQLRTVQAEQEKLRKTMTGIVAILGGIREQVFQKKRARTDFVGKILAKIWSWWFDPNKEISKLSNKIQKFNPVVDELKARIVANMQCIEKVVNGEETTNTVNSRKDIVIWLTTYAEDKLQGNQKESYQKNSFAQAASRRITEFLRLWNTFVPESTQPEIVVSTPSTASSSPIKEID